MKVKKLIPFAKKSFFFIIGFLVVVFVLEFIVNTIVKTIDVGEYGVLNKINEGKINAEILVSGTSRALKAINPKIIEENTGMSCYNIASDGSDLGVQFPKLKWYLEKNKKPKILIQDISQFGGGISHTVYEPFKYLPYLSNDSLFYGLLKIDHEFWNQKYIFPSNLIFYNFDFYAKVAQELLNDFKNKDPFIDGFLPDNSKWAVDFKKYKKEHPNGINCKASTNYKKYLRNLVNFCEKQKIILILIVLPNYYGLRKIMKNEDEVFNFYQSLTNNYEVYYINFFESEISKKKDNFYNFTHLNANGAIKFSKILSERIKSLIKY